MADVFLQDKFSNIVNGRAHCCNLNKNLAAVPTLFYHGSNSLKMTDGSIQSIDDRLVMFWGVGVGVCMTALVSVLMSMSMFMMMIVMMIVIVAAAVGTGLVLMRGGFYLHVFLSGDKVTTETIRYGNTLLYVDFAMYPFLGFIFVVRNCVQGIGRSPFVLGAGAAELVARIAVCLLLPPLLAGGTVSSEAGPLAFYALCAADPAAWIAADSVLLIPFIRNIMKMDYRYMYRQNSHHR